MLKLASLQKTVQHRSTLHCMAYGLSPRTLSHRTCTHENISTIAGALRRAPAIFVSFRNLMKSWRLMVVLFSEVQNSLKPCGAKSRIRARPHTHARTHAPRTHAPHTNTHTTQTHSAVRSYAVTQNQHQRQRGNRWTHLSELPFIFLPRFLHTVSAHQQPKFLMLQPLAVSNDMLVDGGEHL